MYTFDFFKDRCRFLIEESTRNGDSDKIEKLQRIQAYLDTHDSFRDIRRIYLVFILDTLGYGDKVNEVYDYHNPRNLVVGRFRMTENGKDWFSNPVILEPDAEDYYVFTDRFCGHIFKYNQKDNGFYSLTDDQWEYDGDLQRKFYDVGYDYHTIEYVILPEDNMQT